MIRIVNKYRRNSRLEGIDVYCGRPSILGNPFNMQIMSRDQSCDKYQEYFDAKIKAKDPAFMSGLRNIYKLAKKGDVNLVCFCAPKRCHTESIKAFLDQYM